MMEKLVNSVVVMVRLGCLLWLVCINGVRGELCSGYLSSRSAKLNLEFLTLPGIVSRYEGYKCAVGQIGVEGWVDAWIRFCDLLR